MSTRDNFNAATRYELAGRVGWRCAFPGCRLATVGPRKDGPGITVTGRAAHITAAAPGGPRYDRTLTSAQRRSAQNGLWLCAIHADIVDRDELNYSVDSLELFRRQAEMLAHQELTRFREDAPDQAGVLTLVAVGFDLVFEGFWISAEKSSWRFRISRWLTGDQSGLTTWITGFDRLPRTRHFVAVESQGDGRELTDAPVWERRVVEGKEAVELELQVQPLPERRGPGQLGTDLSLRDGDLEVESGDLKLVSGVENAKQRLRTLVNTPVGGLFYAEEYGVRWRELALRFGDDLALLGRLFRLDLARVISAPIHSTEIDLNAGKMIPSLRPQADFIEQIRTIRVLALNPERNRASVELGVIWADGQAWDAGLDVTLSDRPVWPDPPSMSVPAPPKRGNRPPES